MNNASLRDKIVKLNLNIESLKEDEKYNVYNNQPYAYRDFNEVYPGKNSASKEKKRKLIGICYLKK